MFQVVRCLSSHHFNNIIEKKGHYQFSQNIILSLSAQFNVIYLFLFFVPCIVDNNFATFSAQCDVKVTLEQTTKTQRGE